MQITHLRDTKLANLKIISRKTNVMTRLLVTTVACLIGAVAYAGGAASVFMSVNGSDGAIGRTPNHAVATLQRAVEIGERTLSEGGTQVVIEVLPGTYEKQSVVIDNPVGGSVITVRSAPGSEGKPVFDGGGSGAWFVVRSSTPTSAKYNFTGLELRNYHSAISLMGNRELSQATFSSLVIQNMRFYRIGKFDDRTGSEPTAAIRLVGVRNSLIRGNEFLKIKNAGECRLLHSIYLAHGSSRNIIENNKFVDVCGSPLRVRDQSNHNIFKSNSFEEIDTDYAFDEWYCSKSVNRNCTKKKAECSSVGNSQSSSLISSSTAALVKPSFESRTRSTSETCKQPYVDVD